MQAKHFQPLAWLSRFSDVLPSRCLLCTQALDGGAGLLCPACEADLPLNLQACGQCALPLVSAGICPDCLATPPHFAKTVAPFQYLPPLSGLINSWKHSGDSRPLPLLLRSLEAELYTQYQQTPWPELLIPVPLHWRRRLIRGFNQTEQMAQELGKRLVIPVAMGLLSTKPGSHSQQGLNRKQRQHNLKGRFCVETAPKAKHIALVDDVMTTGATASTLAKLLLTAGVAQVDVWLIARTP